MKVLVVPIWQIMANDDGDEDAKGADVADNGCERAMGGTVTIAMIMNGTDYYYDDDDEEG